MPTRDNTISTKRLLMRIYERGYDMVEKQKRGRPSLGITYEEVREAMDRLQNVTWVARELECSPTLVHKILNETVGAEPVTEEPEAAPNDNDLVADDFTDRILAIRGDEFGKEMVASLLNKLLFKVSA
ncbi:MAG: hypothetical protein BZY82_01070 [SAR202 cluster bacterium Io17-Chloro-G3]|nr:MAG: hypothetical protein BZY82_01070 [SAR202 cluster bacterium Io17-Chloro-G3]